MSLRQCLPKYTTDVVTCRWQLPRMWNMLTLGMALIPDGAMAHCGCWQLCIYWHLRSSYGTLKASNDARRLQMKEFLERSAENGRPEAERPIPPECLRGISTAMWDFRVCGSGRAVVLPPVGSRGSPPLCQPRGGGTPLRASAPVQRRPWDISPWPRSPYYTPMREMGTLLVEWPFHRHQPPKAKGDMHKARAEHTR